MEKTAAPLSNMFCPQTLFLFGTYREDGTPSFGLFSWVSYCWDGEFCFMACIGEDKHTRDRIRATCVFSANLVTKDVLPYADFCGNHPGDSPEKRARAVETVRGKTLAVPLLSQSPVNYELSVKRTVPLDGGGELYTARIAGAWWNPALKDEQTSVAERLLGIDPVRTSHMTYFGGDGRVLGAWGDWKPQEAF